MKKTILLCVILVSLAACEVSETGHFTTGDTVTSSQTAQATLPTDVAILTSPPSGNYTVLEELKVTVNKLTAFHPNPTVEQAQLALKKKAASLGANGLIDVTIGEVHIEALSWGARTATGTAIKY